MSQRGGQDINSAQDFVDLVAAEAAEAEGDDVAIVVDEPKPLRRRGLVAAIAAAAGIAVIGLGIAVAALVSDDEAPTEGPIAVTEERGDAPPVTSAPVDEPVDAVAPAPEPEVAPEPVLEAEPETEAVAPPVATPEPAAVAFFEAAVEPAASTVSAGTDVVVTLRVRNTGGAPGPYGYDIDGCDPHLVPPPDLMCTQIARELVVDADAEASQVITIHTAGASPGEYVVRIGTVDVRVTVV